MNQNFNFKIQISKSKIQNLNLKLKIFAFFPQALLKGSQNHTGEHTSLRVGKIRFSKRFGSPVA